METIEPLLSFTLSPTMIEASERRNVVPGTCEVIVDRRLLPGQTPEEVEPILREILGDGEYELETLERWGGTRSALDTPLWTAISDWVGESSRARSWLLSAARASPTPTGCARPSARSRTGSSR